MEYFFDSYAIIEIINGRESYLRFKDKIIITTVLNLAEVYYALLLKYGGKTVDKIVNNLNIDFIEITRTTAIEASFFRFKHKKLGMSYADCIGYVISLNNNLKFLTGDSAFENLENVEFVM